MNRLFLLTLVPLAAGFETSCYEELGCFEMSPPWISPLRPLPPPDTPQEINIKLRFYSRNRPNGPFVDLWPMIHLEQTDFNPQRPRTVFIAHGFASNGNSPWLTRMKDAYLKKVDANIFLVDWGDGAQQLNYLQVVSNTRIVGAELARFGKFLVYHGQNKTNFHLIGHSLGAHIVAYMSKGLKSADKVGRITALDPAQPGFEGEAAEVRLDVEDADFVDVVHTDARSFIPFLGVGMILPVGHVDFYMNNGNNQPGCIVPKVPEIKTIKDLANVPVEVVASWVKCPHFRSIEYFIEALEEVNCTFWGRLMTNTETYFKLVTLGTFARAESQVRLLTECTQRTCVPLGLDTPSYKLRGSFEVATNFEKPYCQTTPEEKFFRTIQKVGSLTSDIFGTLTNPFNVKLTLF